MPALPPSATTDASTRVVALQSQYPVGLLGVPAGGIRLTWRVESEDPAARQLGYQLAGGVAGGELIAAESVESSDSIGVAAPGELQPREQRSYAVRIATSAGWTEWSAPLTVEAGIGGAQLDAQVIGIHSEIGGPVPLLRREFTLRLRPHPPACA